jgi:hypothetical protein
MRLLLIPSALIYYCCLVVLRIALKVLAHVEVPNLHYHQANEEAYSLALHNCKDAFEAISGSYLITKEHLISQFTALNLSWVNWPMLVLR